MRIETETLTLKDGRTLTLRTPDEKDAQALIDYMVKTAGDSHEKALLIGLDILREFS